MESNNHYYTIKAYLEGNLDPKDMHEFEKQALDDPFLAEALEGYSHVTVSSNRQLSILQRQLQERIERGEVKKNEFFFSWQRLSIAAAGGLMLILATVLFWMKTDRRESGEQKTMELAISSADSIATVNISNTADLGTQPEGGWALYEDYLKKNLRKPVGLPKEGAVVIQFKVGSEGELSRFKVLQSLNENADKEAIRLIKEGPAWQTVRPGTQVQVRVNFNK